MKYATEMGSDAIMYIHRSIKIGSGIQKVDEAEKMNYYFL
jgi:hypothetical protein